MTDFKLHSLDRLKAQLLVSGLQQENQPLYQVIHDLIGYLRQNITNTQSQISTLQGSGTTVINSLTQGFGPGFFDEVLDTPEMIPVQGPSGPSGSIGLVGPSGIDGIDGEDGFMGPPGLQGIQGLTGPQGPSGSSILIPLFDTPEITDEIIDRTHGWNNSSIYPGPLIITDRFESANNMRVVGTAIAPAHGVGTEVQYDPANNRGTFIAFDRDAGVFKIVRLFGSSIQLAIGGVAAGGAVTIDTIGRLNALFGLSVGPMLTPASFAVDQNDYNPTGFHTSTIIRLNNTSGVQKSMTGFDAGVDGEIKLFKNISTVAGSDILFPADNAGSLVANRTRNIAGSVSSANLLLQNGDANAAGGGFGCFIYDLTAQRWCQLP